MVTGGTVSLALSKGQFFLFGCCNELNKIQRAGFLQLQVDRLPIDRAPVS